MPAGSLALVQARSTRRGPCRRSLACSGLWATRHRLAILRHLELGEHRVVDLMKHLGPCAVHGIHASGVPARLRVGNPRPRGRASMFSLTQPELVREVLASSEGLLAATGDAATLCPSSAPESA